ncbi:hypothetical protein FRC08_004772 [Ceratobasidium sp. 394]|nr:hypothetical protein FRC08_004772 [Ceratobasidium sp. 394]
MVSAPASALALGHPHLSARSRSLVAILGLRMWSHLHGPLAASPALDLSPPSPRPAQNPALTLYLAHVFVGSCVPTLAFAPVLALLAHARPLSVMRAFVPPSSHPGSLARSHLASRVPGSARPRTRLLTLWCACPHARRPTSHLPNSPAVPTHPPPRPRSRPQPATSRTRSHRCTPQPRRSLSPNSLAYVHDPTSAISPRMPALLQVSGRRPPRLVRNQRGLTRYVSLIHYTHNIRCPSPPPLRALPHPEPVRWALGVQPTIRSTWPPGSGKLEHERERKRG